MDGLPPLLLALAQQSPWVAGMPDLSVRPCRCVGDLGQAPKAGMCVQSGAGPPGRTPPRLRPPMEPDLHLQKWVL